MRVLRLGEENERLDAGELTVHVGDVLLVLKVVDRADAAQDKAGADGVGKVDGERVVGGHTDAWLVAIEGADELQPFLDREVGPFVLVRADGHDDLVHQPQAAVDKRTVADGEGVEGAGEDGDVMHRTKI